MKRILIVLSMAICAGCFTGARADDFTYFFDAYQVNEKCPTLDKCVIKVAYKITTVAGVVSAFTVVDPGVAADKTQADFSTRALVLGEKVSAIVKACVKATGECSADSNLLSLSKLAPFGFPTGGRLERRSPPS